jgi:hypothetical protein
MENIRVKQQQLGSGLKLLYCPVFPCTYIIKQTENQTNYSM